MNCYEQMKNQFLVILNDEQPTLPPEVLEATMMALDRAAYPYDVKLKETALTTYVDPIPRLVKTYIVVKKTEGLSDGTLQNYARILKTFFLWLRKQPEEVTANDIRMFIYDYQQTHRITDRTLDKYREMICWFFHWAHTEEYLQKNPGRAIKPIKHEVKARTALTQLELEYLRMACVTKRERAMLEFLYSTGCRVSELLIVKHEDIDWHACTVHLFGKGKKHRTSYINAKCEVALKEYLADRDDDSDYLFVTERRPFRGMTKASAEKIIRQISDRSSIAKHVTPHILRHTTATQAVNNGMAIEDVSKLLGHASVNTTMIYAKVSTTKVQSEHNRCVI